jgi:hypothetical protein
MNLKLKKPTSITTGEKITLALAQFSQKKNLPFVFISTELFNRINKYAKFMQKARCFTPLYAICDFLYNIQKK